MLTAVFAMRRIPGFDDQLLFPGLRPASTDEDIAEAVSEVFLPWPGNLQRTRTKKKTLEGQFQRQLRLARRERASDGAKSAAAAVGIRRHEISMVQNVEELGAELESNVFHR